MLYLLRPRRAGQSQRSRNDVGVCIAGALPLCNLYIISAKNIKKILSNEDFVLPFQTRESRKINQTYYSKVLAFKKDSAVMFDIVCETCQRRIIGESITILSDTSQLGWSSL